MTDPPCVYSKPFQNAPIGQATLYIAITFETIMWLYFYSVNMYQYFELFVSTFIKIGGGWRVRSYLPPIPELLQAVISC